MNRILDDLNEQQLKAVTYDKGALLVLAGPGAGKTTVLTRRIAYLLNESKGEHFKILALTFTNKAAKEMGERVEELIGDEIKRVFIGTFHSFSNELIKSYGSYIDIPPDFTIYDKSEDLIDLLKDAIRRRIKEEKEDINKSKILSNKFTEPRLIDELVPYYYNNIIKLKNRLIFYNDSKVNDQNYGEDFKLIFKLYNEELKRSSALDFSDLIIYANKLLKDKKYIAKQVRDVNKYILIDEGQDTNKAQFELISTICGDDYKNLFIVADEDQLIFEWNDARFEYLISLVNQYNAQRIQLYESYRCPLYVLEVANKLIKNNKIRISSKEVLKPKKSKDVGSIEVNIFADSNEEAENISIKIKELNDFTNTCVISRNRYLIEAIISKFDDFGIPYYMPMGQERFTTREFDLIINIMRLLFNENDRIHLYNVCKYLNIDNEKIIDKSNGNTLLKELIENSNINKNVLNIINEFNNDKKNFFNYYKQLKKIFIGDNVKHDDLLNDIKSFEDTYKHYTYERKENNRNLGDFLNYLSLSPKKDLSGKGVALLTGHASKGLEFDYVFLMSMNQGIFPDFRAKKGSRALEEERRNCFVSVTRTREKLFISHTKMKETKFGVFKQEPSQFLKEMELI